MQYNTQMHTSHCFHYIAGSAKQEAIDQSSKLCHWSHRWDGDDHMSNVLSHNKEKCASFPHCSLLLSLHFLQNGTHISSDNSNPTMTLSQQIPSVVTSCIFQLSYFLWCYTLEIVDIPVFFHHNLSETTKANVYSCRFKDFFLKERIPLQKHKITTVAT